MSDIVNKILGWIHDGNIFITRGGEELLQTIKSSHLITPEAAVVMLKQSLVFILYLIDTAIQPKIIIRNCG